MSNYDVQNAISAVQSDISAVRSEINQINSQLSQITNACSHSIATLNMTSNNINNSLNNNERALEYADGKLHDVIDTQIQIRELLFIFEDVQSANKKIRALNNKLYFEFNNHSRVRKIVRGFIDNLDLNIVSDEKIYKSIEKEYLQAPNYWLAFALLAIMAWKNDDKKRCERCISSALEADEKSTILFFMLFNIKLKKYDAAIKWFECYKNTEMFGKDDSTFLMLLSSIPFKINRSVDEEQRDGGLSKEFLSFIQERIEQDKLNTNIDSYPELIKSIFEKMDFGETLKYNNLRRHVSDYQQMATSLSLAKNNEDILLFFEEVSQVLKREKNSLIDKYIEELIDTPSSDEEEIHKQIRYNEEIIESLKVVKTSANTISSSQFRQMAKDNYNSQVTHDEASLNLCDELIKWAFVKKDKNVTTLTNWNIFALNIEYVKKAYDLYRQKYLDLNKKIHNVTIDDFSLKSDFTNLDRDLTLKNTFVENKKNFLLKKAIKPLFYVFIALAVVFLGLGIYLSVIESQFAIASYVGSGLCAVGSIVALIANLIKKAQIRKRMDNENVRLGKILSEMHEEKAEFDQMFKDADAISENIYEFFEKNFE